MILSYLKSAPSNFSNCKISRKNKNVWIWDHKCLIWVFLTKNPLFRDFWSRFLKNYCHIWNQSSQIRLFPKFYGKTTMPKFGTKNAWFGYFGSGIGKQYFHIWNQHPRICLVAKFCGKIKILKFGTKMPYVSIFDQKYLIWVILGYNVKKYYCYIWNQHPQICLTARFCKKIKIPKFGTKNPIFGYLWPNMPYFVFWQEFLKNLLSYLKSVPSNLSNCKI